MEKNNREKTKKLNKETLMEEEDTETPVEDSLSYLVMDEMFMSHLKGNKIKHYPEILEHL